ncbi:MAG: HIRAN domain-containing protein [Thiobacillaceae bacterium]|jgi:hypothetical protein|nr:HIRAN domain-containing protein [Thiobacillaceae bacterium]
MSRVRRRWPLAVLLCLALPGLGARAGVEAQAILQTSPLAGFQYHAGKAIFPLMRVGDRLSLHREPDNPHDPRAVRVDWRGVPIGYVPRLDNLDLARLMDRGVPVEARILHLEKARDPWRRVLLEIVVAEEGGEAAVTVK